MVEALRDEFDFRILTRNHDLGSTATYDLEPHAWHRVDGASVMYLPPTTVNPSRLVRIVRDVKPDVIYVNSAFSPRFSILPLLLRRLGMLGSVPFVLAPRGELSTGALSLEAPKKRAFLFVARLVRLHEGLLWHASNEHEAQAIRARFGPRAKVRVAPNLAVGDVAADDRPAPKAPGKLRACFLGRVSPMKRLDLAFAFLAALEGKVEFDVYGPLEDQRLVEQCRSLAATFPATTTVRWHGPVPHERLGALLATHHVMLLPTAGENFGHAILEALRAGCPVLISDRTPWRELERRTAGWDVPLADTPRFVAILQRLVDMDQPEWARWSTGARDAAREFLRAPDLVERSRALFREAARTDG
jgi:glycosyltransferase involved in cell wall biosynthesis